MNESRFKLGELNFLIKKLEKVNKEGWQMKFNLEKFKGDELTGSKELA